MCSATQAVKCGVPHRPKTKIMKNITLPKLGPNLWIFLRTPLLLLQSMEPSVRRPRLAKNGVAEEFAGISRIKKVKVCDCERTKQESKRLISERSSSECHVKKKLEMNSSFQKHAKDVLCNVATLSKYACSVIHQARIIRVTHESRRHSGFDFLTPKMHRTSK